MAKIFNNTDKKRYEQEKTITLNGWEKTINYDDTRIGRITDTYEKIIQNAASNKMIKICYEEGLSHYRRHGLKISLHSQGNKLPGKCSDICSFCDYVCKQY